MSIRSILSIGSSALGAQSERIALIAQNIANAGSMAAPGATPYQRELPVFESVPVGGSAMGGTLLGVKLAAVVRDPTAPRVVHDPGNPLADKNGNVREAAVNPVLEMVDMLEASRAYQANLATIQTARSTAMGTLDLLK